MIEQMKFLAERDARAVQEHYRHICESGGLDFQQIIATGSPKETIIDIVKRLDIGTLIIGSRGHGTLKRYPRAAYPFAYCA